MARAEACSSSESWVARDEHGQERTRRVAVVLALTIQICQHGLRGRGSRRAGEVTRLRSFSAREGELARPRSHLLTRPFILLAPAATVSAGNKLARTLTSDSLADASRT